MVNYSGSLDRAFSALSDPTRRAILARLASEEMRVSDLAAPFDISLPAISRHLKVLEEAGLLKRRREGRVHHCRLDPKPLGAAADWIERHRAFWEKSLDRLHEYLTDRLQKEEPPWQAPKPHPKRPSGSPAPTRRRGRRSTARGPTRRR